MPKIDHFGIIAPIYEKFMSYSENELMREFAELPVPGHLLDIGGGTGRVSKRLVADIDHIEVVDLSFRMLRFARVKQLNARCASGENLPYPSSTFNRVLIIDALHHFSNQNQVIHEIWRVLEPGGLLIIIEPNLKLLTGKLVAIIERILLMNSKFLFDNSIKNLFVEFNADIQIMHQGVNSWFKVKKKS